MPRSFVCKDAVWALQWDRLATALANRGPCRPRTVGPRRVLAGYHSIQITLSALDRLEVRGRELGRSARARCRSRSRSRRPRRRAGPIVGRVRGFAVRGGIGARADGNLAFVYKTTAEIGELGDNTARLHARIRGDDVWARSRPIRAEWCYAHPMGERRHHLRDERAPAEPRRAQRGGRLTARPGRRVGELNGDVDNYADLKALERSASPRRSRPTPR